MPLQETSGAATYDAFGGGVADRVFIEDVFSTHLYTGNDSTQTITNGIDLAGKGGLVWFKGRNTTGTNNLFIDTARGGDKEIYSNTTDAQSTWAGYDISSFNSNGFSLQGDRYWNNRSGQTYASWTFRKQPKFFDVVTYTGDGTASKSISHGLGSVPGCMIVKKTSSTGDWYVYHRTLGAGANGRLTLKLNETSARSDSGGFPDHPTDSAFTVNYAANTSGATYVAYLFAHDAGGFGLSGTDNVISCGSYTGTGATPPTITLGYEPQWILIKRATGTAGNVTDDWTLVDNMRGLPGDNNKDCAVLAPNSSDAENVGSFTLAASITATGFQAGQQRNVNGATYIYIAIRRGPMKVPTSGTEVFSPLANSNATGTKNTTNFPVDMQINTLKAGDNRYVVDRLRGVSTNATARPYELRTNDTAGENATNNRSLFWDNTGFQTFSYYGGPPTNAAVYWNFRRAPGFFDICCFTATGSNFSVTHNLGVVPELVITKERNGARSWYTYSAGAGNTKYLALDGTAAATTGNAWQDTTPTSTTLYLTGGSSFFSMSQTYVAYLFASCPGVSKVGSYTGTGTTKQIDCGFTGGARFVLIKRINSTGDWYVWDSARGIVAGNDPYLLLNSTAAEVTNTDYVDTYSAGFELSSTAPAGLNANGGTYIFLAIA